MPEIAKVNEAEAERAKKLVMSEKEKEELERLQKEEEERKKRLQLYVFVMRCIAYPFNAKQPTDMARRQQKVGAPGRPRE